MVELALIVVLALLLLAAVELVVPRVAVPCLVCGGKSGVVGDGSDLSRQSKDLDDGTKIHLHQQAVRAKSHVS